MFRKTLIFIVTIIFYQPVSATEPWDSLDPSAKTYIKYFGPMAGVHALKDDGFITTEKRTVGLGASGLLEQPVPVSVLTLRHFSRAKIKIKVSKNVPQGQMRVVSYSEKGMPFTTVAQRRIVPKLPHEKREFGVEDTCYHVVIDAGDFCKLERPRLNIYDLEECDKALRARLAEDLTLPHTEEEPLIEIEVGEETRVVYETKESGGSCMYLPNNLVASQD